jgi:hypothetical protein
MRDLLHILAESATALDQKGLFKEAELVDDMLQALAASNSSGRQMVNYAMQLLAPLNAADTGASVALKHAVGLVSGLDQALSAAARDKKGGDQVRLMASDALKRFIALSRGDNAAVNSMFDPVLKPMIDTLRALSSVPDEQMFAV